MEEDTENEVLNEDSSEGSSEDTNKSPNSSLSLLLGDIIEITAPSNLDIHEMTCIIEYIDNKKLIVINVSNLKKFQFNLTEEGAFTDESITGISLLNRSDDKGYARQNHLIKDTWVDIYFGGDIPAIITGEITNLDEDMIELTTYPELDVIYIDFEYKGIPEHIPIDKIIIRQKPASLKKMPSLSIVKGSIGDVDIAELTDQELATMEYTDEGESVIHIPEGAEEDENVREALHDLYLDSNEIIFGEKLEPLYKLVEVGENEQRYGLENQVDDLMDELLSTIPNSQRTKRVIDNIHLLIERFKQLRESFSKFDENDNIYDFKTYGAFYKPLIERIKKVDTRLQWLIPVVSMRKKIYDINDDADLEINDVSIERTSRDIRQIERLQKEYYEAGSKTLDYASLNNRIANIMLPIDAPFDKKDKLLSTQVMCNIDSIVDNLDDFKSTIHNVSGIAKRKYIIQHYGLGLTKMEQRLLKSGKKQYARVPMTPNDDITLKSLIMLPSSVMRYSKIELPGSTLMEKAAMHQLPFLLYKLLHKKTDIIPNVIEDLEKELDYEQMEKDTKREFLSGLHEFILSEKFNIEDDKFNKFLEVIIPKTRLLIRVVRKYIKDKVSFIDVVKSLEPFMIYSSDITYKQYMEIRFFIKERITQLKLEYSKKSSDFNLIRSQNYNIPDNKMKTIQKLLSEEEAYMNMFLQAYKLVANESDKLKLSSQEVLSLMLTQDGTNLYTRLLTLLMISLITPDGILDSLNETAVEEMSDLEKIKPVDCAVRYLAKKYSSITELQKDNNVDVVYFDKDYDDTPYDILKKYKDKQKTMPPEDFVDFLAENLIQKHDCPPDVAPQLAKTLISNKKTVEDGHYAILELKPKLPSTVDESKLSEKEKKEIEVEAESRKKMEYYRRLKNNWVHDDTIGDDSFLDTNSIFCNVSDKCFKNTANNVCESVTDTSARLKEVLKNKLKSEFDARYEVNVEELKVELTEHLNEFAKLLKNIRKLGEIRSHKQNNLSYELGKFANSTEIIESPHAKLRDLILGQDDFSKKQFDIIRFFDKFCREPMIDALEEDANWKYCLDTNTKLLPGFLFELALEFTNGGDYAAKQGELCHRIGKLSDDGDSFVDKHSGYVICKMDLSTEEGHDEAGFRVTTHAILEKDLGAVVLEAIGKKEKRIFETELSEMIYNVYTTIASNIDIPIDGVDEFVLRVSNELIEKTVKKQEVYEKESAKYEKEKGKKRAPYMKYRNELIVIIIASTLFISIQTAVPSFQTKKTFPGCVRSFSGFPLGGIEDITGIQYISCVLSKIKSSIEPWNSLNKNPELIAKQMKEYMEKVVLKRSDIEEIYVKKREYMVLNPEKVAPEEHSIQKWSHYLPPVIEYSVSNHTRNISSDFKRDFLDLLRKGSLHQHHDFNVIKSKAALFGFLIIENINHVVTSKDLLLKTSSKIPFMENACCNENMDLTNPLQYFISENENIKIAIKNVEQLSQMIHDINLLSRASMFYHPEFSGIIYPSIPVGHLEENIYAAFIHYCNFDRNLPVPIEFETICSEKPVNYKKTWTITEKMEFLKKNGKRYTVEQLYHLMRIVNEQNMITINKPVHFTKVDVMKDLVDNLDRTDSTIVEDKMREHLRKVLDKFNPKVMVDIDSDELENLKEYLYTTNDLLYKGIIDFFQRYGKLPESKYNKLNEFLTSLTKWTSEPGMAEDKYNDEELYSVTQYIQNAVQSMSKTYPNILLNMADHCKIPKHWGLSDIDNGKLVSIIKKYYEKIEVFKKDTVVTRLLMEVSTRLIELNVFTQNIPIITPIKKAGVTFHSLFDKKTIYALLQYCFFSVLCEYIFATDDVNLLRIDIEDSKKYRRQKIDESKKVASTLSAQYEDLNEEFQDEEDDLEEQQIKVGNTQDLKERVCQLLLGFLDIEETNKKAINFSYSEISHYVGRSREKEKRSIIKYLGDMSLEQRRVEDNLKRFKLEKWNVGMQKGLFQYDKATNERESRDLVVQLMNDVDEGEINIINEFAMDVYGVKPNAQQMMDVDELEQFDAEEVDQFYNREAMGIDADLGENYADGEYYEEDRDDETDYY